MIYLDHAATTPVREEVIEAMSRCLGEQGHYANPGSEHVAGRQASQILEQARERFAQLIGAGREDIIFCSGATEANNMALLGMAGFYGNRARKLLLPKTEHKSVLDPCRQLSSQGYKISWLKLAEGGVLTPSTLNEALDEQSLLATCMLLNNETGVINNIPQMAQYCSEKNVLLHSDAAQALGKVPIAVRRWGLASMSFSAHKLGGPKGVGALYLRRKPKVAIKPLMFGGGQERGLRSGTLPLHQIVGLVRAAELAVAEMETETQRLAALRERLWAQLCEALPDIHLNAHSKAQSPHILNLSFEGVDGEALRADLDQLAVSSGSACTSDHAEPSYVLRALGRSDALADSSLRFSFSWPTQQQDVDLAAQMVIASVKRLRAISPSWSEAA